MNIFEQEITDGLQEKLTASTSISYASEVAPSVDHNRHNIQEIKSLASFDDSDLYYVQSILVSSSWNKNDDIFDKKEVWAARHTPEDKPTNLEHDEATIIGHITSNWPISEDGELIDENTDIETLPDKYHILTGSVIYRGFSNIDLKNRSDKIIAEIEQGTKYVSMECYFKGFDYGLINKETGEYKVLPRNETTAYLTKYLKAYGGQGEHENYKIGRVLKDITFSGKGFVDKPANPDSIIFTKNMFDEQKTEKIDKNFADLSVAGVSDNQSNLNVENNIMNLEAVQAEVAELKARIESVAGCSEVVKEAYSLAAELKDKIVALEADLSAKDQTIAELTVAQEALAAEKEEAAKKKNEEDAMMEEKIKKVASDLEAAMETIAGYKMKEEEMAKKEKKMKRAAALIEVGLDNETANATADQFESLDDDTFAAIVSLAGKMPPWLKDKKDKEEKKEEAATKPADDDEMHAKKKASEDTVDASVLETAEVTPEVNLGVGGETESALETTRAALVEFVSSRLGKKQA